MTPTTSHGRRRPVTVAYAFLDFNDGGAQRVALTTFRALDPARYRPVLICVRGRGTLVSEAEAAGVPVQVLGRLRRAHDVTAVPAIAGALQAVGAGIAHVPLYSRVSPYVRVAAPMAGVPLTVAHEHTRAAPPPARRRWVDRALAPRTRFVAVSGADRRDLVAAGVAAGAIEVIHNGVDLERFRPASRLAARARLGLPAGRSTVLVPARLVTRKGHADLLAALPALVRRVPDLLVLAAGGGPLERVLPALAEAAGLAGHVRFLGHRADVPELLAASDVVALPSRVEGLPLAVLEALAAGRPVVATRVGGVAEAVDDGVTGCLVPPRVPAELAAAIGDLLVDDGRRAAMALAARTVAEARFGSASATRRLEAAYDCWLSEVGHHVVDEDGAPAEDATVAATSTDAGDGQ